MKIDCGWISNIGNVFCILTVKATLLVAVMKNNQNPAIITETAIVVVVKIAPKDVFFINNYMIRNI